MKVKYETTNIEETILGNYAIIKGPLGQVAKRCLKCGFTSFGFHDLTNDRCRLCGSVFKKEGAGGPPCH